MTTGDGCSSVVQVHSTAARALWCKQSGESCMVLENGRSGLVQWWAWRLDGSESGAGWPRSASQAPPTQIRLHSDWSKC